MRKEKSTGKYPQMPPERVPAELKLDGQINAAKVEAGVDDTPPAPAGPAVDEAERVETGDVSEIAPAAQQVAVSEEPPPPPAEALAEDQPQLVELVEPEPAPEPASVQASEPVPVPAPDLVAAPVAPEPVPAPVPEPVLAPANVPEPEPVAVADQAPTPAPPEPIVDPIRVAPPPIKRPIPDRRRSRMWAFVLVMAATAMAALGYYLITDVVIRDAQPVPPAVHTTMVRDTAQENACVAELQASRLRTYSEAEARELCRH